MSKKTTPSTSIYKKLSHREHVLLRPAMYVGSTTGREEYMWLVNEDGRMEVRAINFIPALHKIFDEILVNVIDHKTRMEELLAAAIASTKKPKSASKKGAAIAAPIEAPLLVTNIWITLTNDTITVKNDGNGIPVTENSEEKMYNPELIFTELLTGQNYEEDEEKLVGGQNGLGAKLANIYSTKFHVETVDAINGLKFSQSCFDNMIRKDKPRIVTSKLKPYTLISFTPDMSRFTGVNGEKYTEIPDDMLASFRTRVYQMAICAGTNVKVYLNEELINCKTMPMYMEKFTDSIIRRSDDDTEFDYDSPIEDEIDDTKTVDTVDVETTSVASTTDVKHKKRTLSASAAADLGIFYERSGPRWEYGVLLGDIDVAVDETIYPDAKSRNSAILDIRRKLHQNSFVNGINTSQGGTHVEHVRDQIIKKIREYLVKKKIGDIEPSQLKDMFVIFVNSMIINPEFTSQTKEQLITPVRDTKTKKGFGSAAEVSDKFIDRIMKGGLEIAIVQYLEGLEAIKEAKTDGRGRGRVHIEKYDGAIKAGTAESSKCTLILTEGDSAKTLALSGLSVIGREFYGVFPLRGKVMNVKESEDGKKRISTKGEANKEIQNIKKILGLVSSMEYTPETIKMLRYGHVMIMTDQDLDGSHIKGLLLNLFHTKWRSLLQLGYLTCMVTPIIKAYRGSESKPLETVPFYSITDYEAWLEGLGDDATKWKHKYYKGLGTSTANEAREYFADLNPIYFKWDDTTDRFIRLAFSKNKNSAHARKEWLDTYDVKSVLDFKDASLPISKFVNKELIHFSIYSNLRAIPHMMDGLKPSQRKILWACYRRNLTTTSIKVAQLSGYVSEHAAYHHGETSLQEAIVGMAQNFVYSNNINLLYPQGQFGSRLLAGKDAASARYIFTRLTDITKFLFRKEDEPVLKYMEDDGEVVEPEFYVPILPVALINGANGVGTGYSSNIPMYNPRDLIAAARLRIKTCEMEPDEAAPYYESEETLMPWIDRFKGKIEQHDDHKYISHGIWEITGANTIFISELPLGTCCENYKNFLLKWQAEEYKHRDIVADSSGKKTYFKLKKFDEDCTDIYVRYTLMVEPEFIARAREDPEWASIALKLSTCDIRTSNMVAFDTDMHIQRYVSPNEIIDAHAIVRLEYYQKRKDFQIADLEAKIPEKRAKREFIAGVMNGTIDIRGKDDATIVRILKTKKFPPLGRGTHGASEDSEESDARNPDAIESYTYLLNLKQSAVSKKGFEALKKEEEDMMIQLEIIMGKTPPIMWSEELDEFEVAYEKFMVEKDEMMSVEVKKPAGGKRSAKKPKK